MILVITWSALGLGMGESMILTAGPAETMASFMVVSADVVVDVRIWEVRDVRRDAVVLRREEESIW